MTVWLLVLTISTMGVSYINGPPTERLLVASPEAAAIRLWDCKQTADIWTHCTATLYEIGLRTKTVRTVEIPTLTFEGGTP